MALLRAGNTLDKGPYSKNLEKALLYMVALVEEHPKEAQQVMMKIVEAAAAREAARKARELYTRRMEGVSLWVMRSKDITASDPADGEVLFEPAKDKVYRHPTFYTVPDGIENI